MKRQRLKNLKDKYFWIYSFSIIIIILITIILGKVSYSLTISLIVSWLSATILYFIKSAKEHDKELLSGVKKLCIKNVWQKTEDIKEFELKFENLIKEAKNTLIICGLSLDHFSKGQRFGFFYLEEKTNLNLKLLFLNPFSIYATAHSYFRGQKGLKDIDDTIKKIKKGIDFAYTGSSEYLKRIEIKLTNYLPRFRVVNIDNEKIYISLYMYGSQVAENPTFLIEKQRNCDFFEKVKNSLEELWNRSDNIILFGNGQWNKDWEFMAKFSHRQSCLRKCFTLCDINKEIQRSILGVKDLNLLKDYNIGFFTLDKIKNWEDFVKDKIRDDLKVIYNRSTLPDDDKARIKIISDSDLKSIISIIKPIVGKISYQEYIDIFRRAYSLYFWGNPNKEINLYNDYKKKGREIAFELISVIRELKKIEDSKNVLKKLFYLSIVSGVIGLEDKIHHDAASKITCTGLPLEKQEDCIKFLSKIFAPNSIFPLREYPITINHMNKFFKKLYEKVPVVHLVSFPDDYIESVILLAFYQELLERYSSLKITVVPKPFVIGNDITLEDINSLLEEDIFKELAKFLDNRFFISDKGPTVGGLNIKKMSLDIIQQATFLDVRGARSFEMAQGIDVDAFFSFVVCRPFSKYLTGCDYNNVVIIYQPKGEKSFDVGSFDQIDDYRKIEEEIRKRIRSTTRDITDKVNM